MVPGVTPGQSAWFLVGTNWTTGAQQLSGVAPGSAPPSAPGNQRGGGGHKHHGH
jgi:hypothetical protein